MKIAIIDYGMGNLYSVRNSFSALGAGVDIMSSPEKMKSFDKIILPGVGAFGDALKELKKRKLVEALKDFAESGKPLLGICLGMQLLFDKSQESGGLSGLGLIAGEVKRFSDRLKCPHMGWNEIERAGSSEEPIFSGIKSDIFAYFCHSYYVLPKDKSVSIGRTDYGVKFSSIIRKGRIYGVQFHPEKSQDVGLKMLDNFIRCC